MVVMYVPGAKKAYFSILPRLFTLLGPATYFVNMSKTRQNLKGHRTLS